MHSIVAVDIYNLYKFLNVASYLTKKFSEVVVNFVRILYYYTVLLHQFDPFNLDHDIQ